MRNSLFFFIAFVTLMFSACETDFQLEGEWKDIPVVYAFLSEQDTAYYVRVEKAFLEPGGDATEIAQIPDSIYYKEEQISVSLEVNKSEFVSLMGSSGSGKSTLMNIISCLDTPSSGSYFLNSKDVAGMNDDELALIRNEEIGIVSDKN